MNAKISKKYRKPLFALMMSAATSLLVSGVILAMRHIPADIFLSQWRHVFMTAWPVVFIAIMVIAPGVQKLVDHVVEEE